MGFGRAALCFYTVPAHGCAGTSRSEMGWLLALLVTAAVVKAAADWQFAGPTSSRRRKLQEQTPSGYEFCVDFFEFDGYRGGWTNCTLSNCELYDQTPKTPTPDMDLVECPNLDTDDLYSCKTRLKKENALKDAGSEFFTNDIHGGATYYYQRFGGPGMKNTEENSGSAGDYPYYWGPYDYKTYSDAYEANSDKPCSDTRYARGGHCHLRDEDAEDRIIKMLKVTLQDPNNLLKNILGIRFQLKGTLADGSPMTFGVQPNNSSSSSKESDIAYRPTNPQYGTPNDYFKAAKEPRGVWPDGPYPNVEGQMAGCGFLPIHGYDNYQQSDYADGPTFYYRGGARYSRTPYKCGKRNGLKRQCEAACVNETVVPQMDVIQIEDALRTPVGGERLRAEGVGQPYEDFDKFPSNTRAFGQSSFTQEDVCSTPENLESHEAFLPDTLQMEEQKSKVTGNGFHDGFFLATRSNADIAYKLDVPEEPGKRFPGKCFDSAMAYPYLVNRTAVLDEAEIPECKGGDAYASGPIDGNSDRDCLLGGLKVPFTFYLPVNDFPADLEFSTEASRVTYMLSSGPEISTSPSATFKFPCNSQFPLPPPYPPGKAPTPPPSPPPYPPGKAPTPPPSPPPYPPGRAPTPPPPSSPAGSDKDPHLHFAHGGQRVTACPVAARARRVR